MKFEEKGNYIEKKIKHIVRLFAFVYLMKKDCQLCIRENEVVDPSTSLF